MQLITGRNVLCSTGTGGFAGQVLPRLVMELLLCPRHLWCCVWLAPRARSHLQCVLTRGKKRSWKGMRGIFMLDLVQGLRGLLSAGSWSKENVPSLEQCLAWSIPRAALTSAGCSVGPGPA